MKRYHYYASLAVLIGSVLAAALFLIGCQEDAPRSPQGCQVVTLPAGERVLSGTVSHGAPETATYIDSKQPPRTIHLADPITPNLKYWCFDIVEQ